MGKFKLWDKKFIPMFTKEEWNGREHKLYPRFECNELPLSHVKLTYDDMLTRHDTTESMVAMQKTQDEHMDVRGFCDIAYNFVINPEGVIYEGRDWFTVPTLPLKYFPLRYKIIEIAFMGDFSEKDPPWPMMRTAQLMIMKGLRNMFINSNFRLIGFRDPLDGELPYIEDNRPY